MPIRQKEIEQILAQLSEALQQAPSDADGLISITLKSSIFPQHGLPRLGGNWFYWSQPDQSTHLLGLGEALRISCTGHNRLEQLAQQYEVWRKQWQNIDLSGTSAKLISFTGFAFDANDPMEGGWQGWPNAAIFFPELTLQRRNQKSVICFTSQQNNRQQALVRWRQQLEKLIIAFNTPEKEATPSRPLARTSTQPTDQEWISQINQATKQIRNSKLNKVVPFRRISVESEHPLNPAALMANLDRDYASSYHFSAHLNDHTFASVTPERLILKEQQTIRCDAIGGTSRRGNGVESDRTLGNNLLSDEKCLYEHSLVVKNIHQALKPLCTKLENPETPSLIRLPNLQHLWTGFEGTLKNDTHLMHLCRTLHPTAAVNGYPPADADEWLSEHTASKRGWYSGAAGWLDTEGNGELAVLLRCALLQGNSADLFAGAGITDASEPDLELQETELKFTTMLRALQHAAY